MSELNVKPNLQYTLAAIGIGLVLLFTGFIYYYRRRRLANNPPPLPPQQNIT